MTEIYTLLGSTNKFGSGNLRMLLKNTWECYPGLSKITKVLDKTNDFPASTVQRK